MFSYRATRSQNILLQYLDKTKKALVRRFDYFLTVFGLCHYQLTFIIEQLAHYFGRFGPTR